jgi:hypothetical protein
MLNQRLRGLPQTQLKPEQTAALRNKLETIGFFDWAQVAAPSGEGGGAPHVGSPHFSSQLLNRR